MSQQSFPNDLSDRHTWIQRGIRILENHLHVFSEDAHLVSFESCQIHAVITVFFILLERIVLAVCFSERIHFFHGIP